ITASADTAKTNACNTNVDLLNSQIEMWAANKGSYPADVATLVADTDYFPDGAPECPFGTAYVMNANDRVTPHSH
ncbi:MAG: hypothetical protein PHP01_02410, partial [Phycisphaerae bacterium]|nr:hypothetical protein [Phycisphaerae bacterium]